LAGKQDSHHAVNNDKSNGVQSHVTSNKSDHHSNVPAPKSSKSSAPAPQKGKGK
jgi:hypothetical protein